VPITLIARQRGWSRGETAGTGEVVTTLIIALVVWFAGIAFATRLGNVADIVASTALALLGIWIAGGPWRELRRGERARAQPRRVVRPSLPPRTRPHARRNAQARRPQPRAAKGGHRLRRGAGRTCAVPRFVRTKSPSRAKRDRDRAGEGQAGWLHRSRCDGGLYSRRTVDPTRGRSGLDSRFGAGLTARSPGFSRHGGLWSRPVDSTRAYARRAIAGREGRRITPRSPMPILASGYAATASSRACEKSRRKSRSRV
jgi:hypothetical protein